LGFREEYYAKKALDELSNTLESEITVVRDGSSKHVSTKELVPGDICFIAGGNIVPADIKWLQGDIMSIDTAALTGESIPRKYPSNDYGDLLLNGTTVRQGECYGRVLRIGTSTEMGKAQADVMQDKSVRMVSVFQRKITKVVKILISTSLSVVLAVILVEGFVYNGFKTSKRDTILDGLGTL
jgi:H+-transporting ATPase